MPASFAHLLKKALLLSAANLHGASSHKAVLILANRKGRAVGARRDAALADVRLCCWAHREGLLKAWKALGDGMFGSFLDADRRVDAASEVPCSVARLRRNLS